MSDELDNIVSFPEKDGVQQVHEIAPRAVSYCRHRSTILDSDKRQLTCKTCGAVIEPFDWISARLEDDDRYFQSRARLKREVATLRQSVEELKRAETNTKARLKNARSALLKETSK